MHNYPKWISAECVSFLFGLRTKRRTRRVVLLNTIWFTVINVGRRLMATKKLVLLAFWRLRIVDKTIQFCGASRLTEFRRRITISTKKICIVIGKDLWFSTSYRREQLLSWIHCFPILFRFGIPLYYFVFRFIYLFEYRTEDPIRSHRWHHHVSRRKKKNERAQSITRPSSPFSIADQKFACMKIL